MRIPETPPRLRPEDFRAAPERFARVLAHVTAAGASRKYLHWDKLKHLQPPATLTAEEWWLAHKIARAASAKEIPLASEDGVRFRFSSPDLVLSLLHDVSTRLSRRLASEGPVTDRESRNRYLVNSLIDEAITSSQLEGASTTRAVAKEMIRSGRPPIDSSERMILCNWQAMELLRGRQSRKLTPALIDEVHRVIDPHSRTRTDADQIRVEDTATREVLHVPPPARVIEPGLAQLCRFANEPGDAFVHPIVKAIVIHFWLAWIHPYTDGNGRTARALFYWSMVREGYWLAEFVSISRVLRKAPTQYARAFLHTETDENDLTYFIVHHLDVLVDALDHLDTYIAAKVKELAETRDLLRKHRYEFNHRQLALLSNALKVADARYTIHSHQMSHAVVYQTARQDLLDLVARKLLTQEKKKKLLVFRPAKNLRQVIQRLGK